jgi:hypothetical protein
MPKKNVVGSLQRQQKECSGVSVSGWEMAVFYLFIFIFLIFLLPFCDKTKSAMFWQTKFLFSPVCVWMGIGSGKN